MNNQFSFEDDERINNRARHREEMRRKKKRQQQVRRMMRKASPFLGGGIAVVLLLTIVAHSFQKGPENTTIAGEVQSTESEVIVGSIVENTQTPTVGDSVEGETESAEEKTATVFAASTTASTRSLGEDIVSQYAILVDINTDNIIAQKSAMERMNPASMTKVLTVLVAAEQITKENLDDTFTMTLDITDYSYVNDCSTAGFLDEETVTVRDLFYGTVLPSGGEAAVGLATYIAGSHEAFVDMMNDKLAELGLSDTAHFTNCVGIYDENHYCTAYDMAMILEAAMENEICREVLSAHVYTTSVTPEHPEGIVLSNWFLRRIEDKETFGTVVSGKTGYVSQAGSCAASYGEDANGNGYICVTGNSSSSWQCIYDQVAIYDSVMQ